MGVKGVFLDRDGTLNEDKGYTHKVVDLRLLPGAGEAVRLLHDAGYLIFIVSNQSGIGRGFYTAEDTNRFNHALQMELEKNGVKITAIIFCPHAPEENCTCRKPKPKMIVDLAMDFDIDLADSWVVGDKSSDVEAGIAAGARALRLTENLTILPAAEFILNQTLKGV